uniref:ABC transporter ATP-binding protein n=1 Tax=Fervidobacterium pennivorans TaxID=93466 RepID=A0A7V4FFE6_FERPE
MNGEKKTSLLKLENVTKIFKLGGLFGSKLIAVNQINFELKGDQPEIVSIVGESGSGKTTLARMILGLIEPTHGRIIFKGKDVTTIKNRHEKLIFRKEVQPIFQNPFEAFNPLKKVESYLFETAKNLLKGSKEEILERVERAVEAVGMKFSEISGRYPNEFSGGQLQRLAIARALITQPSLLVADEPVSMVDASLRMSILNLFKKLNEKMRVSIIYITHDLATAYYMSYRIVIMFRGVVIEMGPSDLVLLEPFHPYTKLLLESIPKPDPEKRWKSKIKLSDTEIREYGMIGCKFVNRCPYTMEKCRKTEPPLFQRDDRFVRCFLYE